MKDLRKLALYGILVPVLTLLPWVSQPRAFYDQTAKEAQVTPSKDIRANPSSGKGADIAAEEQDQDIMEQALSLIEASQDLWVKGDVESALEMLDQAYALILDTNGEPDIARQKDDLRLLISKRILAIYSATQTATPGKRSEVPLVMNADVEKEIRSFQGVERDFFIGSYQRSFIYRPMILRELKKAGLPEELSWLPLVESGFKIAALSPARALGLWQFIPSTGYKYNLNRDDWIDERMDPEKSTLAAIAYLRELHGMFGDWLTVLAAYNCGEGRVMRVISRQHINYLDRFWDLYSQLPNETARYVPRFLATLHIIRDPQKYGMDLNGGLPKPQPLAYDVVKINKPMRLQDIAQKLELPEEQLNALNAELRFKITPGKPYALKVPPETGGKFVAMMDDIPSWERPLPAVAKTRAVTITHRVRRGESLGSIATKYGISAKTIRTCNPGASLKGGVKTGQRLFIPVNTRRFAATSPGNASSKTAGSTITYKVKRGDTLSSIASRHSMTMAEVREMNSMKSSSVKIGQVLRLSVDAGGDDRNKPSARKTAAAPVKKAGGKESSGTLKAETTKSKTYVVKKGDNLYRIAANKSMNVERLKELNRLTGTKATSLREGQVLVVE